MLSQLEGNGWVVVEPPLEDDSENTVARYDGEPINVGVMMERIEQSEEQDHLKYRSGVYNVEVKVDYDIGRGQVKVETADGYE